MTDTVSLSVAKELKSFEYRDVDFVGSPPGWLEAKLENRKQEGFDIWRDENSLSWRGVAKAKNLV